MHFGLFLDLESKDLWEKKKTNWEVEDDKVGVVRSWSSKLATQHKSPVMAFIFIFIFVFSSISSSYFFFSFFSFFFLSPLLWFPFLTFFLFVFVLILLYSFYVSKALSCDLHWVRRKLLIFELKMAKCFSH